MSRAWEALLEDLVQQRLERLIGFAALVSGSVTDAPDLVQDALVATFGGRARFDSVNEAEAYVRRAIVSRHIDAGRRRTRERRALQRLHARPEDVAPPATGIGDDVRRALATLSPRERACVVLRQLDDLSVPETAHLLGISEGAVKRYTSDGLTRLDAALGTRSPVAETAPVVRRTTRTQGADR